MEYEVVCVDLIFFCEGEEKFYFCVIGLWTDILVRVFSFLDFNSFYVEMLGGGIVY